MSKPPDYLRDTEGLVVVNFYPYCSGGDKNTPPWSPGGWTALKPNQQVFTDVKSITFPTQLTPEQALEHQLLCRAETHTIQYDNGFRIVRGGTIPF